MANLIRKSDVIILGLIALGAGALSVLDFFNIISLPAASYQLFTLLLLGLIGLHLILTHFSQEDFQKSATELLQRAADSIDEALSEASGFECTVFSDAGEMEAYLGKRMLEAKKSICDLTWKGKISSGFAAKHRQLAHEYMDKCIAETSSRLPYREIFVFSDSRRIDKLERRLSENRNGYSCRYFKEDTSIPRLQFVILDDEEILFFAVSPDSPLSSFRSAELSHVMKAYFEAAWNAARPIKEGPTIHEKEVLLIRRMRQKLAGRVKR